MNRTALSFSFFLAFWAGFFVAGCQPVLVENAVGEVAVGSVPKTVRSTSTPASPDASPEDETNGKEPPAPNNPQVDEHIQAGQEDGTDIRLLVTKDSYLQGENVEFEVSNNSKAAVIYNYGCSWPMPALIENGEIIPMLVSITEEVPGPYTLEPGQSHQCFWNQQVWSNPEILGPERYRSYMESGQVPHGKYRLTLEYYLEEAEVYNPSTAAVIWSDFLIIEE